MSIQTELAEVAQSVQRFFDRRLNMGHRDENFSNQGEADLAQRPRSDVVQRMPAAIVLASAAIISTIIGGWVFLGIWSAIALIVALEWRAMTKTAQSRMRMLGAGLVYAGALLIGVVMLRWSHDHGVEAIFFLFAVVWAADIAAYFTGRHFGGPKLAPKISPKKTWSGMIGGLAGSAIAGLGFLWLVGIELSLIHAGIAIVLGLGSVAGDLFESAFKRHWGFKDSGRLIPGHGGFMDRLDGFIFAVILGAILGTIHGGFGHSASGLLIW
jgi:phosphatidate cytidylyltransferase